MVELNDAPADVAVVRSPILSIAAFKVLINSAGLEALKNSQRQFQAA
jgi:hypothetical protein